MDKGFQWWPEQASTFAPGVDALYLFLIAITVFFTALIFVAIVFLSLKYRRRPGKKPQVVHTSHLLEWTWTFIPFAICMVLFFWSAGLYVHMRRAPDDAMQINVVGKQWMWKIQHPTGKREIDELHLPLGRPVKLCCDEPCRFRQAGMERQRANRCRRDGERNISLGTGNVARKTGMITVNGSGSTFVQNGATTITLGNPSNSTGSITASGGGAFTSGTGGITVGAGSLIDVQASSTFAANGNVTVQNATSGTGGTGKITVGGTGALFTESARQTLTVGDSAGSPAGLVQANSGGTFTTGGTGLTSRQHDRNARRQRRNVQPRQW